jgi:protein required for attachment to host cells
MTYWIAVSNTNEARIYSIDNIKSEDSLNLVESLSHPESKEKRQELSSDRPGHYHASGFARGAYSGHTDLRDVEIDKFAREVAGKLEAGRVHNSYKHLILIMPSHFYGIVEKNMTTGVSRLVEHAIQKDYMVLTPRELQDTLIEHCTKLS